jgi:hypothetical protein
MRYGWIFVLLAIYKAQTLALTQEERETLEKFMPSILDQMDSRYIRSNDFIAVRKTVQVCPFYYRTIQTIEFTDTF